MTNHSRNRLAVERAEKGELDQPACSPPRDYEESEGVEEYMADLRMSWRSIRNALLVTAIFAAAFYGFAVITG